MRNLQASDLFTDSELRMFQLPLTSPLRSGGCELGNSTTPVESPIQGSDEETMRKDMEWRIYRDCDAEDAEESDGPDPHDIEVETEMEREAREHADQRE